MGLFIKNEKLINNKKKGGNNEQFLDKIKQTKQKTIAQLKLKNRRNRKAFK